VDDNCTKKSDGTIHRYAHWGDAGLEIDRLLEVMRLPAFADAHPVLQAAYAHLGLAAIHPFDDGNGRVARAVSSALLQRSVGIPLIVYADQKDRYLTVLERADQGDNGPFIRFVFDRCLHSIRFVADRLAAASVPALDDFERLYAAQAGLSFQDVTSIALRLHQELVQVFQEVWAAQRVPAQVTCGFSQQYVANVDADFRGTNSPNQTLATTVGLASQPPANAQVSMSFGMFVARDISDRFPFVIVNVETTSDRFDIRLEEVYPQNTTDFVIGRRAWVERKISEGLSRLYELAKANRQT
jgi:fido (protein-threonine AMPylation protein)